MSTPYRSFLLRFWVEPNDPRACRAMLENPADGERRGFASLADLFTFIQHEMEQMENESETTKSQSHGDDLP